MLRRAARRRARRRPGLPGASARSGSATPTRRGGCGSMPAPATCTTCPTTTPATPPSTDDGSWVVRRTVLDVVVPGGSSACRWRRGAAAPAAGGPSAGCPSRGAKVPGRVARRCGSTSTWRRSCPSGSARGSPGCTARRPVAARWARSWRCRPPGDVVPGGRGRCAAPTSTSWPTSTTPPTGALEELIGERPELVAGPHRAIVEFAKQIDPGMAVDLWSIEEPDGVRAWLTVDGTVHAALALHPRPR